MDTAKLKNFAQSARRSLMDQVKSKLKLVLSKDSAARRESPEAVKQLEEKVALSSEASVIEAVAYTWFNRFCALRFMDVNGYSRIRIVSPADEGQFQPEILAEAKAGHIDAEMVAEPIRKSILALLAGSTPSRDPQQEAYRLLIVAACNDFHRAMPFLFERIADYTELLMPDDLLSGNSILAYTREAMTPEACQDVEVIGWLYQFYISEKKDAVMARKSAVPTEDIPAVTQLFTPHWIVRYLVENSLGRLWLLNHPNSKLREHMPYYIESEAETDFLQVSKPEEIRLLDPAVGSGHMLTYAFDLLYLIYEETGVEPSEIPEKILTHNLYGVEIDERAGELAAFALTMKARAKQRRFFTKGIKPNITVLENITFSDQELKKYFEVVGRDLLTDNVRQALRQFEDAKNFGSLIQPCLSEQEIKNFRQAIEAKDLGDQLFLRETHLKVLRLLEQAEVLTKRYHVVVANPPYMGDGQQNATVKVFLRECYLDAKADLFACFIERSIGLSISNGYAGLVTRHGWMFITSFEKLRTRLLREKRLISLAHLGARGFDSISGEVVQVAAFIFQNKTSPDAHAQFRDLRKGRDEADKASLFLNPDVRHIACASQFLRIPGAPVCYWLSVAAIEAFARDSRLGDLATIRAGLQTGDNIRFLRLWHEVGQRSLGFGYNSRAEAKLANAKWFPINKGGSFRKWCGNSEYVINWFNDGEELKRQKAEDLASGRITANNSKCWNQDHYFKRGLSWSAVSSESVSVRLNGYGYLFDTTGQTAFPEGSARSETLLALLNSGVAEYFLNALSPTMHFNSGNVADLPVPTSVQMDVQITERAETCVDLARLDWDNFETSWDFHNLPLLRPRLKGATLAASWQNWEIHCSTAIRRMQELETENNRLFIKAYGLEGELSPEVPEAQITLARADLAKDMRDFISYSVGCMFGRYSLDEPGLILANAGDTIEDYLKKIPKPSFPADEDNVIPVLDGDWFSDDIASRFREFLKVTFGQERLEENLRFVETALGKNGKPLAIRDYFLREFYTDHVKRYKKRPIYWMFSSPKGSFNALIYMHRYRLDTVSVLLNDYLREFKTKLLAKLNQLAHTETSGDASKAEKVKAIKEIENTKKILAELEDYEKEILYPLAMKKLEIDLDDGVKVNYLKFGEALKKIPGLDKAEED